jgi:PAS domain S-box-containing protein
VLLFNLFYKILSKKFWGGYSNTEQKELFQLLTIWAIIAVFTIFLFFFHFEIKETSNYVVSDVLLISFTAIIGLCLINGKTNCVVNSFFSVPLFVYTYYVSDFINHSPVTDTVYSTLVWLIAGLAFFHFFSDLGEKIKLYFLISCSVLLIQLLKADILFESFSSLNLAVANPLIIFTAIFIALWLLRKKYLKIIRFLQKQLKLTEQSVTKIFQDSGVSIVELKAENDEAGNIIQLRVANVNNAFESNFKLNLYEVQEQKAEYVFNLIFKNEFDINELILFKRKQTTEFHAKNMERWFKVHLLNPAHDKYFLIFEDITKVKMKIAELKESRKRYKVLLEAIPDIFFVIDKDGTYEDFVVKESELFKVEDANIIGSSIYDVGFPENMVNKIYSCIHSSIRNNSIETIEYSLNTPNGTFLYEMRLAKLNSHAVISVARDITKRKTAEFNLEKALVKAEESDRLKSAFLANISHEIRTPMNVITNFSRLLAEAELTKKDKLEITDAISQNGKQLLNMIDNTIHLSKIETRAVDIKTKFCNINTLLRDIYNSYFILIPDSKKIKLNLKLDVPNSKFGFVTDPNLLSETLNILVDNAVKYTLHGNISISYKMIQNKQIKFTISDTGIGIPKEEFKNVYNRFYRLENRVNEVTSGSGIGLSIAQHYVELLGGELEFESTPNIGTEFYFTLPFKEGKGFMVLVS